MQLRPPVSPSRAVLLAAIALVAAPAAAAGQAGPACGTRTDCVEVTPFVATVANFRTSVSGGNRLVTLTLRIRNKLTRPLTLAYVDGSGVGTDDRGNRYAAFKPGIQGIGLVTGTTFDPKFTLQPGESGEARLEFAWSPTRGAIYGTTYEVDLAIREIDPVTASQYRLGREHALRFSGFGAGGAAAADAAPAEAPAEAPAAAAPPPPEPEPDLCAGKARCWSESGLVAEVSSFTPALSTRHHTLTITLKVQNRSAVPVILAYKAKSNSGIDDLGNPYYWGRAGTYDGSAKGIGILQGNSVDPQFALRPGQSRSATFTLIRYEAANKQLGTRWSWDLVLAELEVLPSKQIRSGREFSLSFTELGPKTSASSLGQQLLDAVTKPKP